jgi:hypothetical protein
MQADSARIIASVRQPAYLMHVADSLGEEAESVCAHIVHNGRLTFSQLVRLMAAHRDNGGSVESLCADIVSRLFSLRLVEQVCPSFCWRS